MWNFKTRRWVSQRLTEKTSRTFANFEKRLSASSRISARKELLAYQWPDFHDISYLNTFFSPVKCIKIQVRFISDKKNGYFIWMPGPGQLRRYSYHIQRSLNITLNIATATFPFLPTKRSTVCQKPNVTCFMSSTPLRVWICALSLRFNGRHRHFCSCLFVT